MTRSRGIVLSLVFLGLAACATTSMHEVSSEPGFNPGQLHKVLILNMGTDSVLRARVEDEFVRQWKKRGVDAQPSYRVLPPNVILDKAHVDPAARDQKFDAVLVTRLLGSQKINPNIRGQEFEVPVSTGLTGGATTFYNPLVASPEYSDSYRMAAVTTRVYDMASEKVVWTGTSQTLITEDATKLVKPFVATVLDSLYKTP